MNKALARYDRIVRSAEKRVAERFQVVNGQDHCTYMTRASQAINCIVAWKGEAVVRTKDDLRRILTDYFDYQSLKSTREAVRIGADRQRASATGNRVKTAKADAEAKELKRHYAELKCRKPDLSHSRLCELVGQQVDKSGNAVRARLNRHKRK